MLSSPVCRSPEGASKLRTKEQPKLGRLEPDRGNRGLTPIVTFEGLTTASSAESTRTCSQLRDGQQLQVARAPSTACNDRPLVLYAIVGSNLFSAAEVPADAVRVLLWLFFAGVVALIVDEVGERLTQEAGEVKKAREREHKPK